MRYGQPKTHSTYSNLEYLLPSYKGGYIWSCRKNGMNNGYGDEFVSRPDDDFYLYLPQHVLYETNEVKFWDNRANDDEAIKLPSNWEPAFIYA